MKTEKLTPQIAALYLGQKCTVHLKRQVSTMPEGTEYVTEIEPATLFLVIHDSATVTPHLRGLDSLKEEGARELYEISRGEIWNTQMWSQDEPLNGSCLDKWWSRYSDNYERESDYCIGSPDVWLKLLDWGFDLFGLIDAGLAKDIDNGAKQ